MQKILLLISIFLITSSIDAQTVYGQLSFISPQTESGAITLDSGQIFEIVGNKISDFNLMVKLPEFQYLERAQGQIVGPCDVKIVLSGSANSVFAMYKITNTKQVPTSLLNNTVVTQEDADGIVEIILESFKDLINWNAANPGTYLSTAESRFFPVRAIKINTP